MIAPNEPHLRVNLDELRLAVTSKADEARLRAAIEVKEKFELDCFMEALKPFEDGTIILLNKPIKFR